LPKLEWKSVRYVTMAALVGLALGACTGTTDTEDMHAAAAATGTAGMSGHDMGSMQMDSALMRRHAEEMDSTVTAMRAHAQSMRATGAGEWYARMGEHTSRVAGMLSMMERHMREMDMGMGMHDDHMGAMMGMSGDDHARMMEEVAALRREVEQLQTAAAAAVTAAMPAHLDRLERLLDLMAQSGGHHGGMHGGMHEGMQH
jgi:hypothetical protein